MADGDLIIGDYTDMPWKLDRFQGVRMFNSGFNQVNEQAEPRWWFEAVTPWQDKDDFQELDAWIVDREGSASTFVTWRQSRPFGKVPVVSDVGLTVSGWNRADSHVSFGNTGVWTATRGDMISYYTKKGGYWIGMVMETRAASGGNMANLKVKPAPFEPHETLAAPRRIRALGEFQMVGVPTPTERVDERRYSFTASQIIRG